MLSLVSAYFEKQKTHQHRLTQGMPNKKLRDKRRRYLELSRASAATEEADPSNSRRSSEEVRHDGKTAVDPAIPCRGSRFKEELPAADAPLSNQGHCKEDLPAADEHGTHNIDIGVCIFAPRVANEIEGRNVFQVEHTSSRREPQTEQRQGEKGRTLSQEQMPPPPRPCDIQPSRIKNSRRKNDKSRGESTGFSKTEVAIAPGPHGPQLSYTNCEKESQVKSSRHRRIQKQIRRNLGLDQTTSREDESNPAENPPESSTAWLPGLVELCNAAYINMMVKDPCPSMMASAQERRSPANQSPPSTPKKSTAAGAQPLEQRSPGRQSYSRRHRRWEPWTASSILNLPSPPLEPSSGSTQGKTFFLDELLQFYQVRELHTINAGPSTLYSCATHDPEVEGALLAYPSFILLHAGKKYPEWPSLLFSSTDDTEEEFGCIHSLPRVHNDRKLDAVPVFKEVAWLIQKVSAEELEQSDREERGNPTNTGSVPESAVPPTQDPGVGPSTKSDKRFKTANQSKVFRRVLSEDSNEVTNGRDLNKACPEEFLEGRRATFLGWYDILGVRYHERRPQALHDKTQRLLHDFGTGVRVHPKPPGSTIKQASAKVVENDEGSFGPKGEVRKEGQTPPEGPTADANPMERSFAANPGRMSPPPRPPPAFTWDRSCPKNRAEVFEFSKSMEPRASAQPASSPPAPPPCRQPQKPEPPIPFTAHIKEKECWTLIWGEAFVNVTLAPASPKSLGRVVDLHGEEALTDPLTWTYKRSVTVAEDGLSCEIAGTDAPDGDAVYDDLGRRFERSCAVRSNNNNNNNNSNGSGGGGDDRHDHSGSRSESDGQVRGDKNPGQGDDGNGGGDSRDHIAVEESSADPTAVHDAENHHDGNDDNEPENLAGKRKASPANAAPSPLPPNFIYTPSMTITVPATTTSPGIEATGVTKVQRIVRQATDLDLQHFQHILRGMCRQQRHRKAVERYALQMQRRAEQAYQKQPVMPRGEVEATEGLKGSEHVGDGEGGSEDVRDGEGLGGKEEQGEEEGAAADEEEWLDTTGATPLTREELDKCRGRGDFWMSW